MVSIMSLQQKIIVQVEFLHFVISQHLDTKNVPRDKEGMFTKVESVPF